MALDSPSISTGSGGGTAFFGESIECRGVPIGETDSEAGKPGGGRPGEVTGDGAAETFVEVELWKRNTFAKSDILERFDPSDLEVVVFVSAGILSMWIGGGFLSRVLLLDFADLTDPACDLGGGGACLGSS
jgi:hypothetical protein